MPKKRYKLKCFGCGNLFYSKEDVIRIGDDKKPYCGECVAGFSPPWEEDNYNEEEHRRDVYIRKYGEY